MDSAILDHLTQIWPPLLLWLVVLYFIPIVFSTCCICDLSVSMSYFLHLHSLYLSLQTMNNYNQSWLICNQPRRSQHVYLTDFSSLNLSARFSILPLNECECLWAWKCVFCQGGMDPPRVKEVQLLSRVGFADYLHIFNDSSPRRLRTLVDWLHLKIAMPLLHRPKFHLVSPPHYDHSHSGVCKEFYRDLEPHLRLLRICVGSDLSDSLGVREKKGMQ